MTVTNWDSLPTRVPFPGVEPKIVSGEHAMISYIHAKKRGTAFDVNLAESRGQRHARRTPEVSCAGGRNILLFG